MVATALHFGAVHGDVCAPQQLIQGLTVLRVQGHADARAHFEAQIICCHGAAQRAANVLCQGQGVAAIFGGAVHAHEHELVTPQAGQHAIVTDETLAVVRHRREHAVAHRMALRVVDLLEAVEVNEQHGGLPALLARSVQKPLGQIHAMGAVGQAGQGVKERQLFHALLSAQQIAGELLALAQVGDEPVALRNIAVDGDAHVQEHHLDERLHGGGGARIAQAGQAIEPR